MISNSGTSKTELQFVGYSLEDGMEFNKLPLLAPINTVLHCSLLIVILAAIILEAPMGVTAIDLVAYFFDQIPGWTTKAPQIRCGDLAGRDDLHSICLYVHEGELWLSDRVGPSL